MSNYYDTIKVWIASGISLVMMGRLSEFLSQVLITITIIYTLFKALNEWRRWQDRKKGGPQ